MRSSDTRWTSRQRSSISRFPSKVERVGEGIEVTFDSGLLFDFDSDKIRPDAAKNFQELANSLKKFLFLIRISSSSDTLTVRAKTHTT